MFDLTTALKLLQLASGAAPMVKAIYDAAKPLLDDSDQAELKRAYDQAYATAERFHNELQNEPARS